MNTIEKAIRENFPGTGNADIRKAIREQIEGGGSVMALARRFAFTGHRGIPSLQAVANAVKEATVEEAQ